MFYPQQTGRYVDKHTDRQRDRQAHTQIGRETDTHTDRETDRHTQTGRETDIHTDRQRDRHTHRQAETEIHTDRQRDRQTHRQAETEIHTDRLRDRPTHRQAARQCCMYNAPSLLLSMREAVFTVSPNKQKRGIFDPTTPATTGPEWIPARICRVWSCRWGILNFLQEATRSRAMLAISETWDSPFSLGTPDTTISGDDMQ